MSKFTYLPETDQWRANETIEIEGAKDIQGGTFVSGIDVINQGEIQITKDGRFKQKGGPFVSQKSLIKREKEIPPYESVSIAERLIIEREDGDIDQIRTYSPDGEANDRALVRVGIEKDVISEKEYNEADNIGDAADLIRERALVKQSVI